MTDKDGWEKYGIQPVPDLSKHYFYKRVQRIPETTIAMVKTEYALAVADEPGALGRTRVAFLWKKANDPDVPHAVQVAAIREIGQIAGDTDAAIKALENSGKPAEDKNVFSNKVLKKYDEEEDDATNTDN